jgi:hypothetical protein
MFPFTFKKIVVNLLVFSLMAASLALAEDTEKTKKPSRKGAIALIATGIGLAGVGAWGITQSKSDCHGQWVSDGSGMGVNCTPIPYLNRDTRVWGGVSIGVGAGITALGVFMLSKHKKVAATAGENPPSGNAPKASGAAR